MNLGMKGRSVGIASACQGCCWVKEMLHREQVKAQVMSNDSSTWR